MSDIEESDETLKSIKLDIKLYPDQYYLHNGELGLEAKNQGEEIQF